MRGRALALTLVVHALCVGSCRCGPAPDVVELDPLPAELQAARRAHLEQRLDEADQAYDALLTRDPGNVDVRRYKQDIGFQRRGSAAQCALEAELAEANPTDAVQLYLAGRACLTEGARGTDFLDRALVADPALAVARSALCFYAVDGPTRDIPAAVLCLRECIAGSPTTSHCHLGLARLLLEGEMVFEAEQVTQAARKLWPRDPVVAGWHGRALAALGQHESAWHLLEAAARTVDLDGSLWIEAVLAAHRHGAPREAWLPLYETALQRGMVPSPSMMEDLGVEGAPVTPP